MNIPRANDITHLQLIELNTRKCLFIKEKKSCIIPTYNFIEMPLRPLTTTEESKSSFIISKYISLLCKTWCQFNQCSRPEVGWSYDFSSKTPTLFILVKLVNVTVSIKRSSLIFWAEILFFERLYKFKLHI